MLKQAVFLDKDGTLLKNVPYNVNPDLIQLMPGAAGSLWRLHRAGYRLIVISNQSGVAHGYFTETALIAVRDRMHALLADIGVPLAGFYYCPHHPQGSVPKYAISCTCRKPAPGLIYRAAREHGVNLSQSWFIGDILNDIEAGRRAGCKTILLDRGTETEWLLSPRRQPHHVVTNFHQVVPLILANYSRQPAKTWGLTDNERGKRL